MPIVRHKTITVKRMRFPICQLSLRCWGRMIAFVRTGLVAAGETSSPTVFAK